MDEIREADEMACDKAIAAYCESYFAVYDKNMQHFGEHMWQLAIDWYKTQPVDPWPCAPKEPGKYMLMLHDNNRWIILKENKFEDGWLHACNGYSYPPLDPSRDGEVRAYNPETGRFEK